MRNLFTKLTFVAGAALAVAACGGSETANTTDNTMMMDNAATAEPMGTTNDMTAVDGGAMDNGSMAMDNGAIGAENGAMMSDNMSNAM